MSRSDVEQQSAWHRLDVVSLVAGVLAVLISLSPLLAVRVDLGVVVPLALVAVGVLGLLGAVRRR